MVNAINALAPGYEKLSDEGIAEKTAQLRAGVQERLGNLTLDDDQYKGAAKTRSTLVPAFALVREAGRRKRGCGISTAIDPAASF
jgi:preprotein translocase subunit SecA